MPAKPQLVLCTVPDPETAEALAGSLVAEQLAACVNIIAGIRSIYRWDGDVESADECLLLIKTNTKIYKRLQDRLQSQHPYELPEIIAVRLDDGLPDYLEWINTSLT